jgi:YD repeat-containing protein
MYSLPYLRVIAICLLCLLNKVLFAQSSTTFDLTSPTEMYAPSSTATSLVKVANVPVSFYTGTPQVSFPCFDIQSGGLEHHISLDYQNGGGIPVELESTWIGLGWNVTAGGAITRTAVGRNDELSSQGYTYAAGVLNMPLYTAANPESWLATLDKCTQKNIADGRLDLSPDNFMVNFDGKSAKMCQDKNGNWLFSPARAWKVNGNTADGYTIITENGTRYEFKTVENSTYLIETQPDDINTAFSCNSAWYLTRIVSANYRDTILFNYVANNYYQDANAPSEATYDLGPGFSTSPCGASGGTTFDQTHHTYTNTNQNINSFRLSSIIFKEGKIDFTVFQDRQDMSSVANRYRLAEIALSAISTSGYTLFKKIKFYQSYSSSDSTNTFKKRLLLNGFTEIGGTDSANYRFTYIDPDGMPARNSKGQDHWGYCNGQNPTTMIPAYVDPANNINLAGANREPDSLAMQKGLLKSINYPTGGVVTFDYEPHRYSYYNSQYQYKPYRTDSSVIQMGITVIANNTSILQVRDTASILIPTNGPGGQINLSYDIDGIIDGDAQADVTIYDQNWNYVIGVGDSHNKIMSLDVTSKILVGHQYYMVASKVGLHERASGTLMFNGWHYFQASPVYSLMAGGCRIKRITTYDGLNHANDQIKRFSYQTNDSISSGYLLDYPKYTDYSFSPYYCTNPLPGNPPLKGGDVQFFTRHSTSLMPLGRTQGSPIGYSKVTVYNGENGEDGREEYYYTVSGIYDDGGTGYPYAPKSSKDALRGLLLQYKTYTATNQLLHSVGNVYNLNTTVGAPNYKWVWGAKYGTRRSSNMYIGTCPDNSWSFLGTMYKWNQFWPVLQTTNDTTFNLISGGFLSKTTTYQYDTVSLQVTNENFISSEGFPVSTTYKYANSFAGQGAVYDSMIARNLLAPVIEKTVTRNSFQTYHEQNNYSLISNKVTPLNKQMVIGNAPLETRLNYIAYDADGNLLQQAKSDNISEVYLWGYNNQYPVARVTGSSYAAVSALVDLNILKSPSSDAAMRTELNKIRTGLAGSGAQVITYTYKPLVGVSSETDTKGMTTYYEYDGLGRLKVVRDNDQKVLKVVDYQYQQPLLP